MLALQRVLLYLKGTKHWRLRFDGQEGINLHGYSNSDWAGDPETHSSTSGYIFFMCKGPVSARSKRQTMVTLSSSEAEYVAASKAAQDVVYLLQLLGYLGFPQTEPTVLYEDNEGCIHMAKNDVTRSRSRHIDMRVHDLRDRVAAGTVCIIPCSTKLMVADLFTKSLPATTHHHLCQYMFQMVDENTT